MSKSPTSPAMPRCPKCQSFHVTLHLRPGASTEKGNQTSTFVNVTYKMCLSCGHTWDRQAFRGVTTYTSPDPKPGFWTRLFHAIFPHLN